MGKSTRGSTADQGVRPTAHKMTQIKPSLDDRYIIQDGTVYLTGIQALVRLPLDQMRRDRQAGLNTASFISGYEGSPLGGYDLALNRAANLLRESNVHFVPGVNEELAATAVWGSQMVHLFDKRKVDGVVGFWYGKGPGVDRAGDALRHANLSGTGPNSAAIALAGDDHACKSSTIPHQSDFSLMNFGIPTFYPGNSAEILEFGRHAIALSRWSGNWAGMKMVTNVCDGGGTVSVSPNVAPIRLPEGFQKHFDEKMIAPFTLKLEMEVNRRRLDAAKAYARLNPVNRSFGAGAGAKLGIVSAGKAFYDLMQALADLGIGRAEIERLGIRIAQFGMTFPVENTFAQEFASGLETILVVEEKRSFLELQLRDVLYNLPARPVIIGKEDERGEGLLSPGGEFDADVIARLLAGRLASSGLDTLKKRQLLLESIGLRPSSMAPPRRPNYCSGCPHNRSTLLLEGQIAGGGIGCSGMGVMLHSANRGYNFAPQMGGEGAMWIGMERFVDTPHIFQNMGDGTLAHSGQLAINAAIASGANMTFKILYNAAVAMTGGQKAEGQLGIPALTRKLAAEGVVKTVILSEFLEHYDAADLAANAEARDRLELERTLAELEKVKGVTAIIYDQQCAAEKRRERSRGKQAEPTKRLVIHEEVCEGCGDCVKQSNCMSLHPVETPLGQKIRIHQSSCNKDYSCALGDCPSFVTVNIKKGTGLKRKKLPALPAIDVPEPVHFSEIGANGYRILGPGIGGTGVVTVNALLAQAALLDGLHVLTLDQTGLAQKGGAVVSHILLGKAPLEGANKTNAASLDLLLGFDLLGASSNETLKTMHAERTVAVVNTAEIPTGDSVRARTQLVGDGRLADVIASVTTRGHNLFLDASRLAEGLFGSHIAVNMLMLGTAWQAGLIPISRAGIEEAIRLNGVSVERNLQIFLWGRKYYHDAAWVESLLAPEVKASETVDYIAKLTAYQNAKYAADFQAFVERVPSELRGVVSKNLYKLMANKDEYEVARLLTSPEFASQISNQWEEVESVEYNLHPPLLRNLGLKHKISVPRWALRMLAPMRVLRGTAFDVFGYSGLRKRERGLVDWYQGLVLSAAASGDMELAREVAALPDQIRGYENIRLASMDRVQKTARELLIPNARSTKE